MREVKDNNLDINKNALTGGESAIDTQEEIDLISGGVGFDEDVSEEANWPEKLEKLRNSKKNKE